MVANGKSYKTFAMKTVADFCGFNLSSSTFIRRYIFDQSNSVLTPCAELAVIGLLNIHFVYQTIAAFFLMKSLPRLNSEAVWYITVSRMAVALATVSLCSLNIFLSSLTNYAVRVAYSVEYSFLTVIWLMHSIVCIFSLRLVRWLSRPSLLFAPSAACLPFVVIFSQRQIIYGIRDPRTFILLAILVIHLCGCVLAIIEHQFSKSHYRLRRLLDEDASADDANVVLNEGGDESAGLFSRIFFCWTNGLILKGYRLQLNEISDLFAVPSCLNVNRLENVFMENVSTRFVDAEDFSLIKSLIRAFGGQFFALGALKILTDILTFTGPVLLHLLVVCLDDKECTEDGYTYSVLMVLSSFIAALFSSNFNFYICKVGLKVRSAVSTAVYDKLLRVRLSKLSKFSTGQILNFMSSDVDRIVNFCNSFHAFWSLPLQFGAALYLLHREVGLAFLSGLIAAVLLVPLNKSITTKIGDLSAKMMHCKDQRVKLISETVNAIRTVKLSNWETDLEKRIGALREKELYYLKGRKYLDAICVYLWASAPILITISIFFTYTFIMHEKLTAAKVFTSLALVNILILPLNAFPWVLNGIVEAVVSVRRLDAFFSLENIDLASVYSLATDPQRPLEVEDATFSWHNTASVNNISFSGEVGTVIGLTGPVGCGKSTFLLGLLGETDINAKFIRIRQSAVRKGFAYVPQNCWLRRGSLRENIICGADFDAPFYDEVVRVTALRPDIQAMPGGDDYEIGDGGCALSGGQRARVALARALYQDREVYLLDDPFASVDSKVGRWIWDEAVMRMLRARGKLVIVATHHVEYIRDADFVIVLSADGGVIQQGTPSIILQQKCEPHVRSLSDSLVRFADSKSSEQVALLSEEKQRGKVRLSVYGCYMRATGVVLTLSILMALAAMQTSKNISDWWLSKWVQDNSTSNESISESAFAQTDRRALYRDYQFPFGDRPFGLMDRSERDRTLHFLFVYALLAFGNTLFTLARAFLFAFGGVRATRNLHKKLLHCVLNASIRWWENNPSGRVINRLCSDVYLVDDSLPFQFNIFLASSFNLLGSVVLTFIALPLLSPFVVILFAIYYFVQRYYRYTTCEVKRLTSLSLSPLYSHITDTIIGLSTIRAFRFTENFTSFFRSCLSDNIRAQFSSLASSQWLSIRLQVLGILMVATVALTAVIQRNLQHVDPGLVGLAITYALSTTNLLSSLLSSFIETEKELISVERIAEYIEGAPQEKNPSCIQMHSDVNGRIDFACVSLRYGMGLPLALENVSFRIEAGTRVAIMGRTGSGKSSLIHCLLRAHEIDSGNIYVDGIDISSVELRSLRSIFGVVTQTPFVFSGTLRENLCLGHVVSDAHMREVVESAGLGSVVNRLGGYDGLIEEGGSNISFGEKQIISICRLVLSRPKILIFDEATAHMDSEAHSRMNSLVRCFLPLATIISIVHRLQDIEHYDLVIHLEAGKVIWQGPPSELHSFVNNSSVL